MSADTKLVRLSRLHAFAAYFAISGAFGALGVAACGSNDLSTPPAITDAGNTGHRDSALVEPPDGGEELDAGVLAPAPSCEKYCDLVMSNCTGANAQYASTSECLAFCGDLPLDVPSRDGTSRDAPSVACRQYWADSPSKTSPDAYCLAAGPFGGNSCGDRCTAFCEVVLAACSPDAGINGAAVDAPYPDQPSCATACAGFMYRDAGTDGGGEGPDAAASGDSLNCRLEVLRQAVVNPEKCAELRGDSNSCKD